MKTVMLLIAGAGCLWLGACSSVEGISTKLSYANALDAPAGVVATSSSAMNPLTAGNRSGNQAVSRDAAGAMMRKELAEEPQAMTGRDLIRKARLTVEVGNVPRSLVKAKQLARETGGRVESVQSDEEESASLTLRVPAEDLESTVESLAALGVEKYRNLSTEDVTKQMIDLEATLKNKVLLRERMQKLLASAKDVKDALAIEKELARVQTEIDQIRMMFEKMKGEVRMSTINLSFDRRKIYGPVGYAGKGAWWAVRKLFVIR